MPSKPHILLAGCGKMGSALLGGWLGGGSVSHVTVLEPNPLSFTDNRITQIYSANDINGRGDMLVLAVKPQILADVCAMIKSHIKKDMPVLSIAAGQTTASIEKHLHENQPVIRAMPNIPASIGKGITGAYAHKNAQAYKQTADTLLAAIGQCVWLDDEALLDAVTAVSGSGPAYVFYLIEMLTQAGMQSGLPADIAAQLARQTVIGSAALADKDPASSPASLRDNVTSPNGTTAAALSVLMDGRWQEILNEAVAKAKARSEELSS